MNIFNLSSFLSSIKQKLGKAKQKDAKAFTLIELILVVAIIGILTAVVLVSIQGPQAAARDSRRQSDLSQIGKGLQAYYLTHNTYPQSEEISLENDEENAEFAQAMEQGGYFSVLPGDPSYTEGGEYTYKYISTTSNSYTLCAKAESKEGYYCVSPEFSGVSQEDSVPMFAGWGETGGETQDYDMIHTLTFAAGSGTCNIRLYRGSTSAYTGTVYYRAGTSGAWTELSVSGTDTTFPVSATTMQIGHDHNKDGNDYMTVSFYGQSTNLVGIAISQKAVFSGTMGNYFMYNYANGCSSLTSLAVPDTSGLTSVGADFMSSYANGCSSLTSLAVPDTSGLTSVGNSFMYGYASFCSSLTSLAVPDTSGLTSVGTYFMYAYAYGCTALTSLDVPDTSGLTSVGDIFMGNYAYNCTALTSLAVPDTSGLTSVGNYFMYNYAYGCTALTSLAAPDTSGLTSVGNNFMYSYAYGCSSLTSLAVPDTSGLTSVGNDFMLYYAYNCTALTSLAVPDTSGLTSVGDRFMYYYAGGCTALTSLDVPDTSGLTSVGNYFMDYYAVGCTALLRLELPVAGWFVGHNIDWRVPSGRLNYLKGYVDNSTDQTAWQALTASPKTLYTNYVRSADNVVILE